ncbi:hypothetical protein REPUB_Repub06bG0049500 [Reevesia pubescens]
MAEAIVSTILEQLKAITIEKASEAWRLVTGVEEEVKRLESNFKAIQLELEDAEQRQHSDKRLKHWLDRFKEVSYDMEDVLVDWKTAIMELQTEEVETSTSGSILKWEVCRPFFPCFSFGSQVVRRHDIATRIKDINDEIGQIVQDKNKFELIQRDINEQPKRPGSTSFVVVSELQGRDRIKEDIIRRLLCGTSEEEEDGSCIPTITIVGMGGIGKTTVAQLVYHDQTIRTHFDKKIWVSVSDPFDESQIARAILEELEPDSTISLQNSTPLQTLLGKVHKKIIGQKILFVFDDVWTNSAEDWKQLKATFQPVLLGSRILVTTRKVTVAKHMKSSQSNIFHLDLLSDEICWLILSQIAFSGWNKDRCKLVEDIGREIAKKCHGLPLTAKTLGGLLQDKLRREEWENVLNSKVWKLDLVEKDIFAPLLLSYYDLPPQFRQCLLYCAIFPKNYYVHKHELIQHWMAQGYLYSDQNSQVALKCEDCFKCLANSFLQIFVIDGADDDSIYTTYKMHDMVHDFLHFLTKSEFSEEEVKSVQDSTLDLSSKKARHLRLVITKGSHFPMSIYGTERLRSLGVVNSDSDITGEALRNLFSVAKRLRLLEFGLGRSSNVNKIPDEIGKLIHLRYLGLRCSKTMKMLPEAVCELHSLEFLDLRLCEGLEKLPDGIGKLISLRYLYTEGCKGLTYYPIGIGRLTSLVGLTDIIARVDRNDAREFSIGDLENLNLLRGRLSVDLVGVNAIDGEELKRAKLHNKIHLKRMILIGTHRSVDKGYLLQALNPPSNLQVTYRTKVAQAIGTSLFVQLAGLQFREFQQERANLAGKKKIGAVVTGLRFQCRFGGSSSVH